MHLFRGVAALLLTVSTPALAQVSAEGQSIVITRTLTVTTPSTGAEMWTITIKCGSARPRQISVAEYLQFYADQLHAAEEKARAHSNTTEGTATVEWAMGYNATTKTVTDTITSTTSFVGRCWNISTGG